MVPILDGSRIMLAGRSSLYNEPREVVDRADIHLRGEHNVLNVLAACAIAGAAGVSIDAMQRTIRAFHGVEHRLEIVRRVNGVTWVNDSIATAPERVLAALKSYDEPLILLLGGRDKKLPWDELAVLSGQKARAVVTFDEHGPVIAETLQTALNINSGGRLAAARVRTVAALPEAVTVAADLAQAGDVVLLSPGGTSYDAYGDFVARGEHFRALVDQL